MIKLPLFGWWGVRLTEIDDQWSGMEPMEQRTLLSADVVTAGFKHDTYETQNGTQVSAPHLGTARNTNDKTADGSVNPRDRVDWFQIFMARPGELNIQLDARDGDAMLLVRKKHHSTPIEQTRMPAGQMETISERTGRGVFMIKITDRGPGRTDYDLSVRSKYDPVTTQERLAYVRTIDGSQNNQRHRKWGAAGVTLMREDSGAHYKDGSSMAGSDRPNAREISNAVVAQNRSILNDRMLSDFVWQWGQFLDHDLDLALDKGDEIEVTIPMGDPHFDPMRTGTQTMPMHRSVYLDGTGTARSNPRQQVNVLTSWIDASNVYGSDNERAKALRTFSGGKLKTSDGDLLPFNVDGMDNAGGTGAELFLAGDIRANEQVGLTAMHTLFVREHNRLADEIAAETPGLGDEQIYQKARKIVGAMMQAITFNEFLPALLGRNAPDSSSDGYDPRINASVSNAFATAAYRIGHTMLSDTILRLDNDGDPIDEGHLSLGQAFFNVNAILNEGGIEPLLKGLASQRMQEIDNMIVDGVRNLLFGPPGAGGLDLATLNIMRGRDHGLADYNTMREDFGLERVRRFSDITFNRELARKLRDLYGDVDHIDAWVGGLAEDHRRGSSVGELFTAILTDQFTRLRDGDRFWYERDKGLTGAEKREIANTKLSDVILRNTSLTRIQDDVFFV